MCLCPTAKHSARTPERVPPNFRITWLLTPCAVLAEKLPSTWTEVCFFLTKFGFRPPLLVTQATITIGCYSQLAKINPVRVLVVRANAFTLLHVCPHIKMNVLRAIIALSD